MAAGFGDILVIGCGAQGAALVRWLVRHDVCPVVLAADRDSERTVPLVHELGAERVRALEVHADDRNALVKLMQRACLTIHCVGPYTEYGRIGVEAAIESGTPYVDINDETDSLQAILNDRDLSREAERNRQVVLVGAGASPGLTNVLACYGARFLDRVERISIALAATIGSGSPSIFAHYIRALSQPAWMYRAGALVRVPPFTEPEEIHFLDVNEPIPCFVVGHPEPLMLPRVLPHLREITVKMGRLPAAHSNLYHQLYSLGLLSRHPLQVGDTTITPAEFSAAFLESDAADSALGIRGVRPLSTRMVRLEGIRHGHSSQVLLRHTSGPITATVAGIIARRVLRGEVRGHGVLGPEAIEGRLLLQELLREAPQFQMETREVMSALDESGHG